MWFVVKMHQNTVSKMKQKDICYKNETRNPKKRRKTSTKSWHEFCLYNREEVFHMVLQ